MTDHTRDLVIDLQHLVLDGFSPAQVERLVAALGPALAREVARQGMPRFDREAGAAVARAIRDSLPTDGNTSIEIQAMS